ncbi:MAG TPA: anhydro-N-acetylmuramic acid kinase, partial [Nitrospiria bacterium]|nr:anhydro-N-acetylmuramic acid kinase [Nitrospiria bacterium]
MRVIGLLSGTSTDGMDAALVDITGRGLRTRIRLRAFRTYPYPPGLREKLIALTHDGRVEELSTLNVYLGELFAKAAGNIARRARVPLNTVKLIGSHGQTICHLPEPRRIRGVPVRSTLQIGEPSVIAERTGVTTVAEFRYRDMAAGGEGAPLTPYLHYILFHSPKKARLIVNIGGINNVTHLPRRTGLGPVVAFDAGPGNMLIDGVARYVTHGREKMDRNGRMASKGNVHTGLMGWLMAHPFLKKKPPKTTGREAFGEPMILEVMHRAGRMKVSRYDLAATVTAFTAASIYSAYVRFIRRRGGVDEVIVGGGGTRNPVLMAYLQEAFGEIPVAPFEKHGIDSRALEAMAF